MTVRASVEKDLWPLIETLVDSPEIAGLAVAVVCDGEVAARGFGVRDVGTGAPVTAETMFHLASVSKPFVATAVVSLELDLDAPIVEWLPEFTLADGRAGEVTARGLLSHTSGLPDVSDYGWHDPQLGDEALSEFARSLSGWRLRAEPSTAFSYSNAGFELLGRCCRGSVVRRSRTPYGGSSWPRSGCGRAPSSAARCPRTWPPRRTSDDR